MNQLKIAIAILFLITSVCMVAQPSKNNVFEGIHYIVKKIKEYDIIAIGETHDKVEVTDFYIKLINNKEFRKQIDVIVIEMGNNLHQQILDDYISGKNVYKKNLYKLWRDHTSCMLNDSDNTGLIRLLKEIRRINSVYQSKIRVIAADPPIDWKKVNCLKEFYSFLGNRDKHYFEVIKSEVIDKKMKGLLIMGNNHFNKQKSKYMIEKNLDNPITSILKNDKNKLYLVNILSASSFSYNKLSGLEKESIITTKDKWLGPLKVTAPFIKEYSLNEQTDAILYLGSKKDFTKEKVTPFNDSEYSKELTRRSNLKKCK